jgi:hypothetical protein
MEPQQPLTAAQRYYQAHKEKRRAYGREYYQKNKAKILAAIGKSREENPPPPPPPSPPESPHTPEPLLGYKRRGITQQSPAVVSFN